MASPTQRIRGAIDRTIAEEQARQKAHATQNGTAPDAVRRSGSTGESTKRQRTKKPSQDTSKDAAIETAPTPDPAVFQAAFEAAFVLDDSEDGDAPTVPAKDGGDGGSDVTKSTTPPDKEESVTEKTAEDANGPDNGKQAASEAKQTNGNDTPPPQPTPEQADDQKSATVVELPLEVRKRLRRLDKLDKNYEGTSRV